jgi:hypothetical protein
MALRSVLAAKGASRGGCDLRHRHTSRRGSQLNKSVRINWSMVRAERLPKVCRSLLPGMFIHFSGRVTGNPEVIPNWQSQISTDPFGGEKPTFRSNLPQAGFWTASEPLTAAGDAKCGSRESRFTVFIRLRSRLPAPPVCLAFSRSLPLETSR